MRGPGAPWPQPRRQGKRAATGGLPPLLTGGVTCAGSRVWHQEGASPLAFLPHPHLLGAPTPPGMVGQGLVFQIQRQKNIRCLSLGSQHCHFPGILMGHKDPRTGQKVLTWKVTTSLNHRRGLVLRHLKVQLATLRGKDTALRQSRRASWRRRDGAVA